MIDVFIRPADKDVIVTVAQVMLSVSLKAVIQEVMCDDRRPRLVLMGGSYNTAFNSAVEGRNLAVALTGINSLAPIRVWAGTKNSRPVDFLQ